MGSKGGKMDETLKCAKCGNETFKVIRKEFSNKTKHNGAYCDQCGSFLLYVSQESPEVAQKRNELTHVGDIEIPFGMYKGIKLKNVQDLDYIDWASKNMRSAEWKEIFEKELKERLKEPKYTL